MNLRTSTSRSFASLLVVGAVLTPSLTACSQESGESAPAAPHAAADFSSALLGACVTFHEKVYADLDTWQQSDFNDPELYLNVLSADEQSTLIDAYLADTPEDAKAYGERYKKHDPAATAALRAQVNDEIINRCDGA